MPKKDSKSQTGSSIFLPGFFVFAVFLYSQGNFPAGKSPRDHAIKKMLSYSIPDADSSEYHLLECNIIDAYLNGSIAHIYSHWIADGQKIPLNEIIQLTTQLISQGISSLNLPD